VLEAGSALGFLLYPPLEQHESFHLEYQGEGQYRFVYYVNLTGAKWEPIFSVAVMLPVGGIGVFKEEVTFMPGVPSLSREKALLLARSTIVSEDLGTPAGAITIRGAWNFQTEHGWDTVYAPIFNAIERPVAPMLTVRVETDWYAHESEFRYVLQPGEGISIAHSMPIGQVFFVPREQITLRDCSDEELLAIGRSQDEFAREKAALKFTTSYGVPYSPHYLRKSRSRNASTGQSWQEVTSLPPADASLPAEQPTLISPRFDVDLVPGPQAPVTRRAGRNEPCPCGSGMKYKKCHGRVP
jgi:hypothetical protein